MSDIRCPMCAKLNPAEADVCQFCQARLKPLVISPNPEVPEEESGLDWELDKAASAESSVNEDVPDWLRSFRDEDEVTGPEPEESDAGGSLPDWLSGTTTEPVPEGLGPTVPASISSRPGEDIPDWLSSLRSDDSSAGFSSDQDASWPPTSADENLPDWLAGLRSGDTQDLPQTPPVAQGANLDEAEPDWLKRIRARKIEDEVAEESADAGLHQAGIDESATAPTEDLLVESEAVTGANLLPEEEPVVMPDWLAGLGEPIEDANLDELPEWLVTGEELPEVDETAVEQPAPDLDLAAPPEELPVVEELAEPELPDWLLSLEGRSALEMEEGDQVAATPGAGEAWLEEQLGLQPALAQEGVAGLPKPVAPFTFDGSDDSGIEVGDLPDWLKTAALEQAGAAEETAQAEPVSEANLSPAALPNWLAAMRPLEAVTPEAPVVEEIEHNLEASGPLAGLRGILRAEPDVSRQHKPAAIPIKLQVSDANQSQVDILKEALAMEDKNPELSAPPLVTRELLVRVVVLLALLLGVGWPVFWGSQDVPLPAVPEETMMLRSILDGLPASPSILLAVDYEAGLSGEMDAAASALLDHLMIRSAYLTLVSTLPNGPLQAERLLALMNQSTGHAYMRDQHYIHLGYIPGGTTGLLAFATAMRGAIPAGLSTSNVWETEHLLGVQTPADFNMVLVITENADTARSWIEQVQPGLGSTPLVVVASAQAEPLLRPYLDGPEPQVSGLIAGLPGAAAYEATMVRPNLARKYWDSFSYGLGVALILILVLMLVNGALYYIDLRKQAEAESKR